MTFVQFPLYSEDPLVAFAPNNTRTLREVAMNDVDTVGGYAVPVDPMDDLMCESCQ